jgi:hypothetical protein
MHGLPLGTARAAADPVLIGAGDIATCGNSDDTRTAQLVADSGGIPFTVGDNAYSSGTAAEFANCYKPTWGRFKGLTHPVVGDNEYLTAGAAPYFDYFGSAAGRQGWYSYDVGTWHVVVLNSNCAEVGGCGKGSAQERWLRADLAANGTRCIAAMWHEPRFSSAYSNSSKTEPFWEALYEYGADIVLNGHHHVYERFAPQDPDGRADPKGIREFIVGTGGMSLTGSFRTVQPNSQVRNNRTKGVLKLTLHRDSYDFDFVPVPGSSFHDSGSGSCGGGGSPAGGDPPAGEEPPVVEPHVDVTVEPAADARVESGHRSTNYGRSTTLTADASPAISSYLRFDVAGVGPVSKATLRLFVKDRSTDGPSLYPVASAWSETGITWKNQPPRTGGQLADVGAVKTGRWVEYDVSPVVTGDGQWSFELAGDSSDAASFKSSEAASERPQLILVRAKNDFPPAPDPPAPTPGSQPPVGSEPPADPVLPPGDSPPPAA